MADQRPRVRGQFVKQIVYVAPCLYLSFVLYFDVPCLSIKYWFNFCPFFPSGLIPKKKKIKKARNLYLWIILAMFRNNTNQNVDHYLTDFVPATASSFFARSPRKKLGVLCNRRICE